MTSNDRYEEVETGQSVAVVGANDTPILYNPSTDMWHVGPAGPLGMQQRGDTPWAWVDGELVVFGGGIVTDEGNGATGCCVAVAVAVAYTPPPGF